MENKSIDNSNANYRLQRLTLWGDTNTDKRHVVISRHILSVHQSITVSQSIHPLDITLKKTVVCKAHCSNITPVLGIHSKRH